MLRFTLTFALMIPAAAAFAHGGGLDKNRCHTNRKTGDYHCHRGGSSSSSPSSALGLVDGQSAGKARSEALSDTRAFANCAEARAAGAAPVRRGDPGYGSHLDRDNDGIGCEPYRGRN